MKNSIVLTLILVTINSWGQETDRFSKGNLMLGGNISGSYEFQDGSVTFHNYTIGLNSNAGYFVLNNFATGLAISYNQDWTRISQKDSWEINYYYNISPMFRLYPWKNLFIAFEPGLIFGSRETSSLVSKTKGFILRQGVGYDFFIKENVALEVSYLYSFSKQTLKAHDQTQFELKSDLRSNKNLMNFGIQIFF